MSHLLARTHYRRTPNWTRSRHCRSPGRWRDWPCSTVGIGRC